MAQVDLDKLLTDLGDALGEDAGYGGVGAPSGRSFGGWTGMYAPMGGGPVQPEQRAPAWPYRTKAANAVWEKIKEIAHLYTHATDKELMARAVEESGVPALELAPEDWRMLEMAVEWHRNGVKLFKPPRIGGAPGGPANFYRDGHTLKSRGAP